MSALDCCNRLPRLSGLVCCVFVASLAGLAAPVRADSLNVFLLEKAGSGSDSDDSEVSSRVGLRGALLSAAIPELGVFDLGSSGILARWFGSNSANNTAVMDFTTAYAGSSSLNAANFGGSSGGASAGFPGAPGSSTTTGESAIQFGTTDIGLEPPSVSGELIKLNGASFINDRFAQVTGIGGGGGSSSDTPPPIVPTPTAALGGLALLGALALGRRTYRTV